MNLTKAIILAASLLLGACEDMWSFHAFVTDSSGTPVSGATISFTHCAFNSEEFSQETDAAGVLEFDDNGAAPECDIVVVATGFITYMTSFDELCGGNSDDCDSDVQMAVQLERP